MFRIRRLDQLGTGGPRRVISHREPVPWLISPLEDIYYGLSCWHLWRYLHQRQTRS